MGWSDRHGLPCDISEPRCARIRASELARSGSRVFAASPDENATFSRALFSELPHGGAPSSRFIEERGAPIQANKQTLNQ